MYHYELGNDASYHQQDYNPEINKKVGMKFIIFRASYGENPIYDEYFREWYERAYRSNYKHGVSAYHFLKPSHDFNKQMEWFQEQIESVPEPNLSSLENTVFLDCEHDDFIPRERVSEVIEKAANYIKTHITPGNYPGIYTSSGWWNEHVERSKFWKTLPLWVAHWTDEKQPLLPEDWKTWHIWQFSVLKGQGINYGFYSEDIDINRMKIKKEQEHKVFVPMVQKPEPIYTY